MKTSNLKMSLLITIYNDYANTTLTRLFQTYLTTALPNLEKIKKKLD